MSIFKRIFSIGKAEANSALNKLEDPIKMTEQGIRDLKVDLDKALQSLAEIKALSIRARNDSNTYQAKAKDYENKAIALLRKAEGGQMDAAEADRLAGEALTKKKENESLMNQAQADKQKFDGNIDSMMKTHQKYYRHYSSYILVLGPCATLAKLVSGPCMHVNTIIKIRDRQRKLDSIKDHKMGTVGCVVRDRAGNIAAGTSTGGMPLLTSSLET